MNKRFVSAFGLFFIASLSCGAVDSVYKKNDVNPQEILSKLVPDVPDLKVVTSEDMEPNPQGKYRRHAFIRGDFNRDGIEDIAIAGTDIWIKPRASFTRNGYILIGSRRSDGTWGRVFFHKFMGASAPFLIWDEEKKTLLVGANQSDASPGDIIWDFKQKQYRVVNKR